MRRRWIVWTSLAVTGLLLVAAAAVCCWQPAALRWRLVTWDGQTSLEAGIARGFAAGDALRHWVHELTRGDDEGPIVLPRFLTRTQWTDGRWEGADRPPGSAGGEPAADRRVTALCLLAFLGSGYDHRSPNRHRDTVRAGVTWLLADLTDDHWDADPVAVCLAVMALAEAYAMTNDPVLRPAVQIQVERLLARQQGKPASEQDPAWWAQPGSTRPDTRLTLFAVMALKAAKSGGIDPGLALCQTRRWLEQTWRAANPGLEDLDPYAWGTSCFPTAGVGPAGPGGHEIPALLLAVFLGLRSGDVVIETLANSILAAPPPLDADSDPEAIWLTTLSLFQAGGRHWEAWSRRHRELLIDRQVSAPDCLTGSWHPARSAGSARIWSRSETSALLALSLQVYYCYQPIAMPPRRSVNGPP